MKKWKIQTCFHQALVVVEHGTICRHTTFRKMDIPSVIRVASVPIP